MATGDITVKIRPDGWSAELTIEGFVAGATYDFDYDASNTPSANTPYLTVVSEGYSNAGALGTITRTVYLTTNVIVPYSTATQAGGTWSGTFLDGEVITCSTSGATALVVGDQSSGAVLRYKKLVGTPLTGQTWSGVSGATFVNTSSTVTTLAANTKDELVGTGGLTTRVSLSDYIYVDDNTGAGKSGTAPTITIPASFVTNTGGASETSNALSAVAVTNSSTQDYANCIARFLTLPFKLINGAFMVECQAFNRHAFNGKPVAAVVFTFTDGTVTRAQTITEMTLSTDVDQLPVYVAFDNASNYTQDASIVCKIQVYPWVGDADNVLDSSANAWQNTGMSLCSLPVGVCDKGNSYVGPNGGTFCCVDLVSGNDANNAYDNRADAEANPVKTNDRAYVAIKSFNNATYSRNTVDGGVMLIKGTGHLYGYGGSAVQLNTAVACTITRDSSTARSGATLIQRNSGNYGPGITRLYDITLAPDTTAHQLFGFVKNTSPVIIEDCTITGQNGATAMWSTDTNGKSASMYKNVIISGYTAGVGGSNDNTPLLVRNVTATGVTSLFVRGARAVVGCTLNGSDAFFGSPSGPTGWTETGNVIYSYNKAFAHKSPFYENTGQAQTSIAFVANLDERIGASGSPIFEFSTLSITNVLFWHNTLAGNRINTEGDIISAPFVDTTYNLNSFKYNSWYYNGTHNPGDVYCSDGTIIGQWPYSQYNVGWVGNNSELIPDIGPANFLGIKATHENSAGYSIDLSYLNGAAPAATGNGNYIPTFTSILRNKVLINQSVIPFSLNRVPTPNNGEGLAGAYQYPNNKFFLMF